MRNKRSRSITDNLKAEIDKITKNMKEISTDGYNFLLGVALDIKNPLHAKLGNLDIILTKFSNSKMSKFVKNAKINSEILLNLVHDTLD